MIKKRILALLILIGCAISILTSNLSIFNILFMPNEMYASKSEINKAKQEKIFSRLVDFDFNESAINTGSQKEEKGDVVFKLFGFIPIKKVTIKLLPEEEVYIGGNPIGLTVFTNGVMVVSDSVISGTDKTSSKNQCLKNGDLITEINGVSIGSISDIDEAIVCGENDYLNITLIRNGKEIKELLPIIKNSNSDLKLGVWVRDELSGIGTLTFVKKEDNNFGALGHAVVGSGNEIVPISGGEIYNCSLINIEKGQRNSPGELRCAFLKKDKRGTIDKNSNVGIYGRMEELDGLVDTNKSALLGGRLSLKPGNAKLISSVSGIKEEYEIEIIKTNYQNQSNDKSFVFRVKDERLISLTGGIVQGMSGSPIMQNGKIVGAVTHVFVADPTKGYGVYTDWMLEELSK